MRKAFIDWFILFGIISICTNIIGNILTLPYFLEGNFIKMVMVSIVASIIFIIDNRNRERKSIVTLVIIHLFLGISSAFFFSTRYVDVAYLPVIFFANVFIVFFFICLLWVNNKKNEMQLVN
ncbi:MAG: hypothetical protein FWC71_00710 [Defluviitaleaceae bacterium]|nr:hypothetical protein [Defluviitaleaceae bacterium]